MKCPQCKRDVPACEANAYQGRCEACWANSQAEKYQRTINPQRRVQERIPERRER